MNVLVEHLREITIVTIDRADRRNAVDVDTARELDRAFLDFDRDAQRRVAVLTGAGGHFCAGADLKALHGGEAASERIAGRDTGPMGPTRRLLSKPVIAAVEGFAVAGGLELACWCDLRVAARSAVFGVFCRRFGVPLVDGGTVRLPRLIGQSRALDMILTGRAVDAHEAFDFGMVNRLVDDGRALEAAIDLARSLAELPQACLRNDRESAISQWSLDEGSALEQEARLGLETLKTGETLEGAARFAGGQGRGGKPAEQDRPQRRHARLKKTLRPGPGK